MDKAVKERLLWNLLQDERERDQARRLGESRHPVVEPTGIPEQVDMRSGVQFAETIPPFILHTITPAGQYLESFENLKRIDPRLTLHNMLMGRGSAQDLAQNLMDVFGVTPPGALESALAKAMLIGMKSPMWKTLPQIGKAGEEVPVGSFSALWDRQPRFEIPDEEVLEAYPQLKAWTVNAKVDPSLRTSQGATRPGTWTIEASAPDEQSLLETLVHEYQHPIQEIEGWARGGSPKDFRMSKDELNSWITDKNYWESVRAIKTTAIEDSIPIDEVSKILQSDGDYLINSKTIDDAKVNTFDSINEKLQGINKRLKETGGITDYYRLAGEMEARDQGYRAGWTQEQRDAVAKYSSENIPLEDLIVRYGPTEEALSKPKQIWYRGTIEGRENPISTLTPDDLVEGISLTHDPVNAKIYAEESASRTRHKGKNPKVLAFEADINPISYGELQELSTKWGFESPFDIEPQELKDRLKKLGYNAIDHSDEPMLAGYGLRVFDPSQLKPFSKEAPKVIMTDRGPRLQSEVDAETVAKLREDMEKRKTLKEKQKGKR